MLNYTLINNPFKLLFFYIYRGPISKSEFLLWTFSEANSTFINIAIDLNIVNIYLSSSLDENEGIEKACWYK